MAEASCIAGIIVWCSSPVDVQFNPCNKSMIVIQGKKQNCGTTMRSAESKIFSILKPPPSPFIFFGHNCQCVLWCVFNLFPLFQVIYMRSLGKNLWIFFDRPSARLFFPFKSPLHTHTHTSAPAVDAYFFSLLAISHKTNQFCATHVWGS